MINTLGTIIVGLFSGCYCEPPPQHVITNQEALQLFEFVGFNNPEEALKIAQCESKLDSNAVGDGGFALGLFQIHFEPDSELWDGWAGYLYKEYNWIPDPFNSFDNILSAKRIYDNSGWNPWTCKKVLDG